MMMITTVIIMIIMMVYFEGYRNTSSSISNLDDIEYVQNILYGLHYSAELVHKIFFILGTKDFYSI
jgi:hypothetical protein